MKRVHFPNRSKLYELAEQQAGYFTAGQARAVGFTRPLLSYHVKTGQFQRIGGGVYRLAQFPEYPHADLYVAWLQAGPHAVISHESALAVYELGEVLPGEVHLTVPRTASRRRKGIRLHTKQLDSKDVSQRAGLPVTTVVRTLADVITGGLDPTEAQEVIQEALARGLVTRQALEKDAARRGPRVARAIQSALERERR